MAITDDSRNDVYRLGVGDEAHATVIAARGVQSAISSRSKLQGAAQSIYTFSGDPWMSFQAGLYVT